MTNPLPRTAIISHNMSEAGGSGNFFVIFPHFFSLFSLLVSNKITNFAASLG